MWLFAFFSLQFTACSTLFHRQQDAKRIYIQSDPEGADVYIDGQRSNLKTPNHFEFDSVDYHKVEIKKDGFEDTHFSTSKVAHYTFFINFALLSTGLILCGIDYLTGAMWTIYPDKKSVSLAPITEEEASTVVEKKPTEPVEIVNKELPNDKLMLDIYDRFSIEEMNVQISHYFGEKNPEELTVIRNRLYLIMHKHPGQLSFEEAVQLDQAP